jgi:predicted Rossmann fold nucleotide-binding protein DprA/Smf involved in DNA uptake
MMLSEQPPTRGATALLARTPSAFFCSRSCPGDIILKAQDWANARGPESAPVIGGFHTPIERDVLRILLRGGAPVTLVLARALRGNRMSPTINAAFAAGQAQIISPFPPTQNRTTAASAEARNRHILTLCRYILIAHASPGGKTEALARDAVSLGRTVYAFSSPGNVHLFEFGALPLDESL